MISVWSAIYTAGNKVDRLYELYVDPKGEIGIKAKEIVILNELLSIQSENYLVRGAFNARRGLKATELARMVLLAPTSFTPILDNLAIVGWIERQPIEEDRRAVNILPGKELPKIQDRIISGVMKVNNVFEVKVYDRSKIK